MTVLKVLSLLLVIVENANCAMSLDKGKFISVCVLELKLQFGTYFI